MNGHYGRKYGRKMRQNKHRLLDELLPVYEIPLDGDKVILPDFSPYKKVNLEIGFGAGEHLALQAKHHPDELFIGCEPFINGIAALLQKIEEENLKNIRIFPDDALMLVNALPPVCLSRVFILFPDPWPKKRHNKRRLVTTENLKAIARKATEQAQFLIATDHDDYFDWIHEAVTNHPDLDLLTPTKLEWLKKPDLWTITRFQEKANAAGRISRFLKLQRK